MIRGFFRFLGLLCLAVTFVLVVYDGTKSIADNMIYFTNVEEMWNRIYARSPQDVIKPAVERLAGDWLWDPIMVTLLTAPTWLVFGIVGAILIVLGRKKKPLIGYTRD